jgi:acyl-CoA reductase-like NAD-dependent aldehyde dehydrogenase
VISLVEADSVAHAIALANASDYTLTASLFTRDLHAALAVAGAVRAAPVLVNGNTVHPEPTNTEIGLGGASGYGRFDVEAFTDRRSIIVYPEQPQVPPMM